MGETFVIKARGLPWSATAEEVVKFFSDVDIINREEGVHFTYNNEGRPSGECFIEVTSPSDVERALAHDNEHMGRRYIEVKEAKHSEMEWVVNRMSNSDSEVTSSDGVIRLRGLPYGCSKQDIADFFAGLQICPYGITITMDQDGRPSGDAYVEFATPEDAEKAMGKHKEKIGHRYIEVFRSSKSDIKYVVGRPNNFKPQLNLRPSPYDRPQHFGGGSRARGRGGMGLGPSGFSSSNNFGSNYDGGSRSSRGGRGGPMRGGRSGGMGGMGKTDVINSKTGHSVHMRGLPFEATTADVLKFFAPLNVVDVRILYEPSGRAKGECDVDFASHEDAEMAMNKDKQNMGRRYIELFLKSTFNGMGGGGGGGGGWSNNNNDMQRGGAPMPLMGRRGNMGGGGYGGGYNAGRMQGGGSNAYSSQPDNYGGQNDAYGGNYQSFSDNVMYPNVPSAGGNFYNV
ncbi:heterogeneous nuclear ribonucleoprotein H3-like [Hydractinia symbiolongicarpus]|uniref:heterogeneous nuclear ribonucleoprotein H3-like n=1 Tax=Hydractinia symbiolongicarpus TaxID=13093 RepID=UPI00254BECD5|nr:heterogeneous nuclear ribonucleoprotein H3-like [Hydractinia symbiolongicarpus]